MLFNFVVLLLVVGVTAYFATQGLLSATLALFSAAFASIFAMGMYEPLQSYLAGWKPQVARGGTMMILFVVVLLVCRLAMDFAVPRNIKLPQLVDRIGGGVMGFFAVLVLAGTSLIGLQMMPLHTNLLDLGADQEYANAGRMQGAEQGDVVPDSGISLAPQRFTLALVNGTSGRSLGGNRPFSEVHPDIVQESYGYRNVTQYGSNTVLDQKLLALGGAFVTDDPALLKKCSVDPSRSIAVIRIEVTKGSVAPEISADTDSMFRITPTQVRLVTDRTQRYPIGHLRMTNAGKYAFENLTLDTGHLIDDYVNGKVVEDWVFQIEKEEKPQFLEVKQLARLELPANKVLKQAPKALAAADYPPRAYRENHGSLAVTITGDNNQALKDVKVLLLPAAVSLKKIQSPWINKATKHIEDVQSKIAEGTEPWSSQNGKPGVPNKLAFDNAHRTVVNSQAQENVNWSEMINVIMVGASESDGATNHTIVPRFFESELVPNLLQGESRVSGVTDASGKVTLKDVAPGEYCIIADKNIENGPYYVWAQSIKVEAKKEATSDLHAPGIFTLTPMK